MSRLAACPKCRNQFTLPELAGPATIACPFCQAHITIKVKAAVPPPAMVVQPAMAVARAMPVDDEDDEEDEEEDPRPRKKKKKKKGVSSASNETGMKIAIVGGILLMTLLAIVFAFWWFMRGDGKPKVIMPSELQQSKNGMRMQPEDDGEAYAEASGNEKFELAERLITNKDLYQSFVPTIILPGLQTTRLDDRLESLPSDVLNRVKNATVYIETERDDGGGTGSGFFACERGLVVTNAHVIGMLGEGTSRPKSCKVYTNHGSSNQKVYKVVDYKVDRKNDLAILKLSDFSKEEYPEPLPLASSLTTRETQKVFSLGFPFGSSAGKEVTVTPLSVSSLRFQDGRIHVVQFAGAMNPGNSGGPIVDASGRIVAVAVRIMTERMGSGTISNTGISMGVPADEVSALHFGRIDRLEIFPPVRQGSQLRLPLSVRLTEHSKSITPRLKIQLHEENTTPEAPDGATGVTELTSTSSKRLFTGNLEVPELSPGKAYWIYPLMQQGDDTGNWNKPIAYKPSIILEDVTLPAAGNSTTTPSKLLLRQRYVWSINQRGSQRTTKLDYEAKTSGGHNPLQDLRVGARVEDQFIPHQDLVRQIWPSRMDDSDTYASGLKIDKMLRGNLNSWHTLADLNLPVGALTPGQTWKLNPKQVFLDYLYGFDPEQNCILQGDYLGSYRKDNQQIGVVRLQGEITDGRGNNKPVGRIAGLALLDGNNRRVLEVIIRCDVSKQVSGTTMLDPTSSIEGFMQLRLQNADS